MSSSPSPPETARPDPTSQYDQVEVIRPNLSTKMSEDSTDSGTAGLGSASSSQGCLGDAEGVCTACTSADSLAVANCFTCASLLCANCVTAHQLMIAFEAHVVTPLGHSAAAEEPVDVLKALLGDSRKKLAELQRTAKSVDFTSSHLTSQYEKAMGELAETYNFYVSMLGERRAECANELEKEYSSKQVQLALCGQKCQGSLEDLEQMIGYMEKLARTASHGDIALFQSSLENRLAAYFAALPRLDQTDCQLDFISNFKAIQVGVRNQFGYVKAGSEVSGPGKQPPISRPAITAAVHQLSPLLPSSLPKGFHVAADYNFNNNNNNDFWSSPDLLGMSSLSLHGGFSSQPDSSLPCLASVLPAAPSTPVYSPKSHVRRQKMIYHCKFGEFGILAGQFTEPSGVAVTQDNEIVVADTNNHRIQIFDCEGNFKFQFGEVGKRDGQLLYPNRVTVVASTGDIVVTERSPTHQVQLFTKFGKFIRKFGSEVLQHPRGVAVDGRGRIVVVECKVMRVVIFDMLGSVLAKFSCSRHLEFPNGVAVNDNMEIFISDNRAHCVKVFDYQGNYLRQVGGEGVISFPIGVGITGDGDVAIADNHNNFNLTVFDGQSGQLVGALESKVKHAQCFDMALMKDGSIVLASKDYRLYIYRYVKVLGE